MESQPQTRATQLLCESPPWSACVCEGWPCCGRELFPPHSLTPTAAEAVQGAQAPALLSLEGPKCFQPLQLSVERWSRAVLKFLEVLHSLHVPLK